MPLNDISSIVGGYGQQISDWALGDDRVFSGTVVGLLPTDPNITDAYFTLKSSPTSQDVNSILQLHITPLATPSGQITGAPTNQLLFDVISEAYQSLVSVGPVYYWDFRVVTGSGRTWTVATGTVVFVQNVTQTNEPGIPAALPNSGNPQFRGFAFGPPTIPNSGIFNTGDWYRNANPAPGTPSGWVCAIGGSPGTWLSDGIVGDDAGGPIGTPPSTSSIPQFRGFSAGPPNSGQYNVGDWIRNSTPLSGNPSGWVCTVAGAPGTWMSDGIVGDTVGI